MAMVEVNIEDDFAAKNEKVIAFVSKVAQALFDSGDLGAVSDSLNAERETLVQEIGENMTIRRGQVVESAEGALSYYVHGDQRRAAIVQLSTKSDEVGRDLAMRGRHQSYGGEKRGRLRGRSEQRARFTCPRLKTAVSPRKSSRKWWKAGLTNTWPKSACLTNLS